MKPFMDQNFLLDSDTAQQLYHEHAAKMPIIDYHCHLDPQQIAENRPFRSITELWLGGDHYKWRAMRSNGVAERFCTGTDTSDWEKFEKWAETVPYTFRNPLYHWTHLELRTAFGIDKILNPHTARDIYDECNEKLRNDPSLTPQGLMQKYNVETVCTTDDPVDDLRWHKAIKNSASSDNNAGNTMSASKGEADIHHPSSTTCLPAWRPDKAMAVENTTSWRTYVELLAEVSGVEIRRFSDMLDALQSRHDFFADNGCRLSDHGIEEFYAEDYTDAEINSIFDRAYAGSHLTADDVRKFKSAMLVIFAEMDHQSGWVQQYHYGAIRNNNTRMFTQIGPDTGFDSIGQFNTAKSMSKFLDRLDSQNKLTKTIIYNLNPADNEVVATMLGNFQDGTVPGKIQWGSGWWFLDQKDGMIKQMNTLSLLGLLSRFVGMLTDSRSFLSYPRHEYFRRTLCNLLGNDVEHGEIPFEEMECVEQMVEDISYWNAKRYFNF